MRMRENKCLHVEVPTVLRFAGVYEELEGLLSHVLQLSLHTATVSGRVGAEPQTAHSDSAAAPRGGRPSVQAGCRSQGSQI